MTHTVTHTGKRADGNNGTNRLRPHPFWTKKRRKALYSKGWKALRWLVRMRSAVRICPAAPKSIENFGFRCFFVAKTLKMVWVKMWVNRLTHTVTHIGNQRLCRLLPAHAPWVQRNAWKEPKSTGEEIASFPVLCSPVGLIESAP